LEVDDKMDATVKKTGRLRVFSSNDVFLTPSPTTEDGGEKVGRLPREIPTAALQALGGPQSPIKAIRAKCVDCSGGNAGEARKCVAIGCALWPFRMGHNPFYGKGGEGEPC
jgi:hypothetical protein